MDRPLSFGFPSVRLAVRSLWFLNSSGQTLAREPPCTPRLLVQQAARSIPYYLLFQLHNATASEWPQEGGQVVSRRKGSIGRWLAELLISPPGGCRPRRCAMSPACWRAPTLTPRADLPSRTRSARATTRAAALPASTAIATATARRERPDGR